MAAQILAATGMTVCHYDLVNPSSYYHSNVDRSVEFQDGCL